MPEDEAFYLLWPNCIIPGCSNKCCLALDSAYCWPHTKGKDSFPDLLQRLKSDTPEVIGNG